MTIGRPRRATHRCCFGRIGAARDRKALPYASSISVAEGGDECRSCVNAAADVSYGRENERAWPEEAASRDAHDQRGQAAGRSRWAIEFPDHARIGATPGRLVGLLAGWPRTLGRTGG